MRTKQEQNKVRRRLLYLWFPHFSIERHKRIEIDKRAKQDDFSGIIIIQDRAGRRVVIASCPLAFQMGVAVLSLEDALAACPSLLVSLPL